MFKQIGTKKSGGKKFSWKKIWNKFRPNRKTDSALKGDSRLVDENLPSCCQFDVIPNGTWTSKKSDGKVVVDIHEIDKDRIRTTCKEALENPPEFPSREEVREKIENAHKYYGIKCLYNYYREPEEPSDRKELQPSWYYILERPLVEQYVLMNNYIRKLSVMASLKNEQSGVQEEPGIEEEVSSISSLSDCDDFAPDSRIAAKLKELKKLGAKDPLPSQIGVSRLEQELGELKQGTKGEERTIKTNDYTIIIREPTKPDEDQNKNEVLPFSSDLGEIQGQLGYEEINESDRHSSGDHLPDMKDFDLSQNLVSGPVEKRTGCRRPSYYHWQDNSTPTKTPLLNMDCQPPVRPRAPGTARDFLSFRNLSLSSEFVDSCRDYSVAFAEECRNTYLKEIAGPSDSDDDLDETCISSATQTEPKHAKPILSLTWEDPTNNCRSALAEECMTDMTRASIVERAALAADYDRECRRNRAIDHIDNRNGKNIDLAAASHISEDELSTQQFEDDDVLRTSVSQIDTTADFTESESASSMETQILPPPRIMNEYSK